MTIETTKIPPQMSGSMIKLLCALRDAETNGESVTLTELSKCVGNSTAGMTGLQDSAVKSGWVTTKHSAHDRRHKHLELTRAGLALVESMRATGDADEHNVCPICGMTPADASDGSDLSDRSDESETSEGKEAA